jgi:hypothetical protein
MKTICRNDGFLDGGKLLDDGRRFVSKRDELRCDFCFPGFQLGHFVVENASDGWRRDSFGDFARNRVQLSFDFQQFFFQGLHILRCIAGVQIESELQHTMSIVPKGEIDPLPIQLAGCRFDLVDDGGDGLP